MMLDIIKNEVVISSALAIFMVVIGVAKRKAIGKSWSAWGNRVLGKKAQDKVEEFVSDIINGAKEDNEAKK